MGPTQGMNSGETVSEGALWEGTAEANTVRHTGTGLERLTGVAEQGESHEENQEGRTWHKLLVMPERRHSDWRLSVRPPLLGVLSISVWQ